MTDIKIDKSWKIELSDEFGKDYFKELITFVRKEYRSKTIYPPGNEIFRAFDRCPFNKVKVVIIGQDPYHGPKQANGLCFSVSEEVSIPPSLQNIYKEIEDDIGKKMPKHGNLERWADQGVLLLNATLTVRAGEAGSHQGKGWEEFTDAVIEAVSNRLDGIVFMLWGSYAQKKGEVIDKEKHYILTTTHPSPLSAHRGFLGCRHFSKANKYLILNDKDPIDW